MLPAPPRDIDDVLGFVDRICEALREAPATTWHALAAAGRRMNRHDADLFTYGVELAIQHDRGALLTYAWQQVQGHVRQRVPVPAPTPGPVRQSAAAGDGGVCGPLIAQRTHPDCLNQDRSQCAAMVQAALSAAIMALVLADLVDRETFDHLVRPAVALVDHVRA